MMTSGMLTDGSDEVPSFIKLLAIIQSLKNITYLNSNQVLKLSVPNGNSKKQEAVKSQLEVLCPKNYRIDKSTETSYFYINEPGLVGDICQYFDKGFTCELLNLSDKSRLLFIENIFQWIGTKDSSTWILDTVNRQTVDILQSVFSITGYKTTKTSFKKSSFSKIVHRLSVNLQRKPWVGVKGLAYRRNYRGYVGCVSVSSGYVLVRKGGATCISGNTINAMNCTHPHIFKGVPKERLVKVAKDKTLITEKGSARDWAKCLQYGIQYLQGAKGLADLHNIPQKRGQAWIDQHEATFPRYHKWVAEEKHLAEVRGWSQTEHGNMRFVREDNAKAAGSSPGRSGVNHLIQGLNKALET